MDPYLEGHLWPDVHNSLAYVIKVQLAPRLGKDYVVHLNNYTVEDTSPQEDIGIMYPDVEVLKRAEKRVEEPRLPYHRHPRFSTRAPRTFEERNRRDFPRSGASHGPGV
jgi:hypothetical protein